MCIGFVIRTRKTILSLLTYFGRLHMIFICIDFYLINTVEKKRRKTNTIGIIDAFVLIYLFNISSRFFQTVGRLFRNFFENQHTDYILIKYSYYSNHSKCTAFKITTRISLHYTSKIFLVRNACVTIITCFLYHYYYYYYLTHRIHNVFFWRSTAISLYGYAFGHVCDSELFRSLNLVNTIAHVYFP